MPHSPVPPPPGRVLPAGADVRPLPDTVTALAAFLAARGAEAEEAVRNIGDRVMDYLPGRFAKRELVRETLNEIHFHFGAIAAATVQETLPGLLWNRHGQRAWWSMIALARIYQDHPDLPPDVRPFLMSSAWK